MATESSSVLIDNAVRFRFGTHSDLQFGNYLRLRDQIYRAELGYSAPPDIYDRAAEFLFIESAGVLVGGARLASREPLGLPLEENGFELSTYLEPTCVASRTFFEVGRIAVLPEVRSHDLSVSLFRAVAARVCTVERACVCTIAPFRIAAMTRRYARSAGWRCRLVRQIRLGPQSRYHHLGEMCICVITSDAS